MEPTKVWRIAEGGATKSALQEILEICKRLCEHLASMTGAPVLQPVTSTGLGRRPPLNVLHPVLETRRYVYTLEASWQNSNVLLICRLESVHKVGNDPPLCQRPANERKKFITLEPSIHLRPMTMLQKLTG